VFARHLATEGASRWGASISLHELDQMAMRAAIEPDLDPAPGFWTFAPISM
jgi:hypothetical protein